MLNTIGAKVYHTFLKLFSKRTREKAVKTVLSVNLVVFFVVSQVALLPMSVFAVTPFKMDSFNYSQAFSGTGELYKSSVEVKGSGTALATVKAVSSLGRQVTAPKTISSNTKFDITIKCGDTITLDINGTKKEILSPACSKEVSSCEKPEGWREEVKGREQSTQKYFFALDKKTITKDDTPENNPSKFGGVLCVGGGNYNYKDESGNFQISKPALVKVGTEYVSSGVEYKAKFNTDPNKGFSFTSVDGSNLDIVGVLVGGKGLKTTPVVDTVGGCINYIEVLPEIDLTYCLDKEGVTKQLVLKSKAATKNNLSKIEFTLGGATVEKKSETVKKVNSRIATKANNKSTDEKEIAKQLLETEKIATDETDKLTKMVAEQKVFEMNKLLTSIKNNEGIDVSTELERIENIPSQDEKLTLNSNIQLSLPISYPQSGNTDLLKSESVSVSKDGKKIIILPDTQSIKKLDKKNFPYIIDPRFFTNIGAVEDTYVAQDGTYATRGGNREIVVGARPEGGVAAVYVNGYNAIIGDAQGYIKFQLPAMDVNMVSSAQIIVNQYGSWQTTGMNAQIIRTDAFSEASTHYYNQPAERSVVGSIWFDGINCNGLNCAASRWSSNIAEGLKQVGSGQTLSLKIKDDSAVSRSATFCSRNPVSSHPCTNWREPRLEIYLKASPANPVAISPNGEDKVAGCTDITCPNSADVTHTVGNLNDGYAACTVTSIVDRMRSKGTFSEWRYPNYMGADWSLFWDGWTDRNAGSYGGSCNGQMSFAERKLGGTYLTHHQLINEDGIGSGGSNEVTYTVDVSSPVRIEKNNAGIRPVMNSQSLTVNIPEYIDDTKTSVYIESVQGGVIDSNGGIAGVNQNTGVDTYVYPSYISGNVFHQWVIESNGQIRSVADGRCLTHKGGNNNMYTVRCQFTPSYTTHPDQKWQYLPETGQIQYLNDRSWCLAKEGGNLMLRWCDTNAQNQKWNVKKSGYDLPRAYSVNDGNKVVQYQVLVVDAATGTWLKTSDWSTSRNQTVVLPSANKGYAIYTQARDRSTGVANYSYHNHVGSVTIDNVPPVVTNLTIDNEKIFSPNGDGKKENVIITYDYQDANPYWGRLTIKNTSGTEVRRVDAYYAPLLNGVSKHYFNWDGKDNNGNQVPEGKYSVHPMAVDQTCNGYDWYTDSRCNRTTSFGTVENWIVVDRTPANINVMTPQYNVWTNNKNYTISGQFGTFNQTGKEDKNVKEGFINGVKLNLNSTNNYSYQTSLVEGRNEFNIQVIDQAENTNSLIGSPTTTRNSSWILNLDTNTPTISNIVDTASGATTKSVRVDFTDALSGVNPSLTNISLYRSVDNKTYTRVGDLVSNNVKINTTYLASHSCSTTSCTVNLQGLTTGYYKLFVQVTDNARNSVCTQNQIPNICNSLVNFEKVLTVGNPTTSILPSVTVDNTRGLLGVEMMPTLDGVNSDEVLAKLSRGEITIDQVQGLTVKVRVSQGVEAVDLAYSYDTNINPKKVATINGTLDTRTQYLGRNANLVSTSQSYTEVKNTLPTKVCESAECIWSYTIAYDKSFGGLIAKLVFTSYKSTNGNMLVENAQKDFVINGQMRGNPSMLRVDSGTKVITFLQGIYHTNQLSNKIWFGADPSKSYTINVGGVNYTATTNTLGIGSVNVTLPATDNVYNVTYTLSGIVTTIGKIKLDRVAPSVVGVTTTNISNTNSIVPFIKGGDRMRWEVETNEPVMLSSVILEDNFRGYGDKVVTAGCIYTEVQYMVEAGNATCNSAWYNSKVQVMEGQVNTTGVEKIYYPTMYAEDYAGNVMNAKNAINSVVPYNITPRGKSTDYRLFVDNTVPSPTGLDVSTWRDGKTGVNADGISPEVDRLDVSGTRYVIRGSTVTFKIKAEKFTRARVQVSGSFQNINPTNVNCSIATDTVVNGVITKFGSLCDLTFVYTWTGAGAQDELGQAYDYKEFSLALIDLSGNISVDSSRVVVYNDRTAPTLGTGTLSSSDVNSPINEGFTKSLSIISTDNGERMSDVSYEVKNPKNVVSTRVQRNGDTTETNGTKSATGQSGNMSSIAKFPIGSMSDDRTGCVSVVNGRRIGICEDGVYTITTKHTDTSGNTNAGFVKTVERDTVAPEIPTVSVVADEANYSVSLKVVGEAGTTAILTGASHSEGPIANQVQGIWRGNYVFGGTYIWNVQLKDKAGNLSGVRQISYTTKAAPILTSYSLSDTTCVYNDNTKFVLPFVGSKGINSGFGPRVDPITKQTVDTHKGIDYNLAYGESIISAGDGTVSYVGYDAISGNMVTVDHGNGVTTWYAHLSEWLVAKGAKLTKGTLIGKAGSSGTVTGTHLHFEVKVNGVSVDPNTYLFNCEKVVQPEVIQNVENPVLGAMGTAESPWNGKSYSDILTQTGKKNIMEVNVNKDGVVIGEPKIIQTASMITYVDTKPDKIVVYGLGVPEGSEWTYRVNRELAQNQCLISGWACDMSIKTRTEEFTVLSNNFKSNFSLINRANIVGDFIGNIINSTYGDVTEIDSQGRWSMTLLKSDINTYKADCSKFCTDVNKVLSLDLSKGFSLSTLEKVVVKAFNLPKEVISLQTDHVLYDVNTNMKVIPPAYTFAKIDQPLYVTGDWAKLRGTYYDQMYLDTRIVKLIPVGNEPSTPTVVNLFAHGWDPFGPEKFERSSNEFENWINLNKNAANDTDKVRQINMAEITSTNDRNSLNLAVSWKDASIDLRYLGKNQPTESAKWIVPVSEQIAKQLINYFDSKRINPAVTCTGHSLGTLLCTEIGKSIKKLRTGMNLSKLVTLDAPKEILPYNLDGRGFAPISKNDYFKNTYTQSISYFGVNSFCGNADLSNSANISIAMKFDEIVDICSIHGKVVEAYLKILKGERKISLSEINSGDILNITNFSNLPRGTIGGVDNINVYLYMYGGGNISVGYAITNIKLGELNLFAYPTNEDNISRFIIPSNLFNIVQIYENGTNDIFNFN